MIKVTEHLQQENIQATQDDTQPDREYTVTCDQDGNRRELSITGGSKDAAFTLALAMLDPGEIVINVQLAQ